MIVKEIMKESNISIDDVRWYLCLEVAKKLLALQNNPIELVSYIHSKNLEIELYEIEQRYIDQLEKEYEQKIIDEATIREILYRINKEKSKRTAKTLVLPKPSTI